jgi:PhnB protein
MITPYIVYNGKCKEAMSFYQKVFNAEIKSSVPYGEYIPEGIETPPENLSDWVMHAEMDVCGTNFWFADETQSVSCGNMIKLTVTVSMAKTGQEYFDLLKVSGNITLPPTETYYSNFHAAVVDKYGVCWNIVSKETPSK